MPVNFRPFTKSCLVAATAMLTLGCQTLDQHNLPSNGIVQDALSLNETYSRASNAIILKNILRARDRWPTNYTTLSGIKSVPASNQSIGAGFSPLGLGNAAGPFKSSSANVSTGKNQRKEYNINPFASDGKTPTILKPVDNDIFKEYFEAWPRDVVTLLFVGDIEYEGQIYANSGDEIGLFIDNLAAGLGIPQAQRGAFDLKKHITLEPRETGNVECAKQIIPLSQIANSSTDILTRIDQLEDAFKGNVSLRRGSGTNQLELQACDKGRTGQVLKLSAAGRKAFPAVSAAREVSFDLRSFDSMIYYLGETLRNQNQNVVKKPGCDIGGPQRAGPLFVIYEDRRGGISYAAEISHNGKKYAAVPNASDLERKGGCIEGRSSTVLSILDQLLLLNQSSEFLKAPQNFFN